MAAPIDPGTFKYRLPDGSPFPGATKDAPNIPLVGTFKYRYPDDRPLDLMTKSAVTGISVLRQTQPGSFFANKGPWW